MSAAAVRTAIAARLDDINGLAVVIASPNVIQKPPLAYVEYAGDDPNYLAGGTPVVIHHWRWRVRVCVDKQDPVKAEDQLITFANSVPEILTADLRLTAAAHIAGPIAQSSEGEDGYPEIGGEQYRAITFRFTTKETP